MNRLVFALRRGLFVMPRGMALNAVLSKLKRTRAPARRGGEPAIDAEYGIDTAGVIGASNLRTGSPSDLQNFGYAGSDTSILREILASLPRLEDACFVDLGCGKGRPLVVASEFPFRRILGVELSGELAEIARSNAEQVGRHHPSRTRIEVVQDDAASFDLPDGYVVLFFYNSTYEGLLRRLVERVSAHGGKLILIYYNPAFGKIVDANPRFSRYSAARYGMGGGNVGEFGNTEDSVVIWQNDQPPMLPPRPGADAPIRVAGGGSIGRV